MKRQPEKIVFTEGLEDIEVVRAWWLLGAVPAAREGILPQRVELLRKRPKSIVYRLPALGLNGTDVIAKHCLRESAIAERRAYEVLERLPLDSTHYYGYVGNGSDAFCWLFLEDAGGEPLDPKQPEQRELATRWLAKLHASSGALEGAAHLPERGPDHYHEHLRAAQRAVDHALYAMDLPPEVKSVLRKLQEQLDTIGERWMEVEALSRSMPWALVHGDFAERNVRVRRRGPARTELLAFDWEVAGWGFPGVDLGFVDLDVYYECQRHAWPQLDRHNLERFAHLGNLLRGGIAAVHWEVPKLDPSYLDVRLGNIRLYLKRIEGAMRGLGWTVPGANGQRAARDDVA